MTLRREAVICCMKTMFAGFKSSPFSEKCRILGELCFVLLIFGCALTGGGHYLSVGPLTPRLLLGGAILVLALPVFWIERREQVKNPLHWMVLVFLLYMAAEAVRGFRAGNNHDVLMSDIKGFAWMFLVPCALVLLKRQGAVERICRAMTAGALLQAVLYMGFNYWMFFSQKRIEPLNNYLHEIQWGAVDYGIWGAFRIFGNSSIYLAAASLLLLYEIIRTEKPRWEAFIGFGLLVTAIVMTMARSLYGAWLLSAAVILVLALLLFPEKRKRSFQRFFAAAGVALAWLLLTETVTRQGFIEFAAARSLHLNIYPYSYLRLLHGPWGSPSFNIEDITSVSDNLRAVTKAGLMELFRAQPLIGAGLGATSLLRDEADEYFYLDILARGGAAGLLLYLLPIGYAAVSLLKRGLKGLRRIPGETVVFATLSVFMIATYFNPWMNAVLGITWLAVAFAAAARVKEAENGKG